MRADPELSPINLIRGYIYDKLFDSYRSTVPPSSGCDKSLSRAFMAFTSVSFFRKNGTLGVCLDDRELPEYSQGKIGECL